MERINKFLARCNLGSRRKVEQLILDGKIIVNNKICTDLNTKINLEIDVVKYDNKIIKPADEEKIYIMMNKPRNYLVTAKDDFNRKTIFELLPDLNTHLFAVGRLDYKSEGLLIVTNDGEFSNQIIHPRYKLQKLYKVVVSKKIDEELINKLKETKIVDGKKIQKPKVFVKSRNEKQTVLKITIFEGQKRQIRKMIKQIGFEVSELKRLQIGNLKLDKLPVGMWRFLKPNEVLSLLHSGKKY